LKVAQIMAGSPAGGAELFFERLAIALHRAGDDVLPVIRRNGDRAGRLVEAGLRPVQLGFGGPLDLFTGPLLARVLKRFAPRVAVAWMNRAARFTPNGPWVTVGRLGGYYDLDYYHNCDHLVGNTKGIADWIVAQGRPAGRVHYLPNFAPDMAGTQPADRAALGIPAGAKLLLALGRLHTNKAFDVLIRALARLPGTHLLIAGEGPERAALEDLARREGVADRLHLPGWRTDTAALIAAADILVCPSRHEPLGNVVIEAFGARIPVVAAASAGPKELIVPDEDGILVPLEDPEALAQALAALLADPQKAARLVDAGRARFEAEFAAAPVLGRWRHFLATVEKP
jgi:glycosyltransferase involved in cell wall biosynthesis